MSRLLHISASPRGSRSESLGLARAFLDAYRSAHPADTIVEWYTGSGLRTFLEAMDTDVERAKFLEEYTDRIRAAYPPRPDGRVLLPFLRLFVIATK